MSPSHSAASKTYLLTYSLTLSRLKSTKVESARQRADVTLGARGLTVTDVLPVVDILNRVVPDFGSGSGKFRIRLLFGNPAKPGFSQTSSRICWMPVQLQYVQLITDNTNTADLSSGVFAILISGIQTIKIQNPSLFHKFRRNWQTET